MQQRPNRRFPRRGSGDRPNASDNNNGATPPSQSSNPAYPQQLPESYPYNQYAQNPSTNPNPNFSDPNFLLHQLVSLFQYPTNAATPASAEYPPGVNPPEQVQLPQFQPQFQQQQRGRAPNRRETRDKTAVEEVRRPPPQSYPYNQYTQNPSTNPNFVDPNFLIQHIVAAASATAEYPPGVNPSEQIQMPQFPPQSQQQQRGVPPNRREAIEKIESAVPPEKIQMPQVQPKFQQQKRGLAPSQRGTLEKIELAVEEVRREMIESGDHIFTWTVIQSVLVKLKAESWESLGFQIQQVPSLRNLILTEGKINAFIHCFVAVRTICSLFDMEVAICENEGIEKFEELGLGPFIRHPLVEHYFLSKDMTEVYKITGEEIISHLKVFILKLKGRNFDGKAFLSFVANECKVPAWEKMGLRIQSLGTHIGFIRDGLRQEDDLMKAFFSKEKDYSATAAPVPIIPPKENNSSKRSKKRPLFSLEKKQIDKRYNTMSERVASFSSAHKDFRGKHIRFSSSSSDDGDNIEDVDDEDELESQQRANDWVKQKDCPLSSQTTQSDKGSRCPYPSQAEEMTRLGLKGETKSSSPSTRILKENDEHVKKKRKLERKRSRNKEKTCRDEEKFGKDKAINCMAGTDLALSNDSVRMFIETWKEACHQHSATEVFEKMMEYHCTTPKLKKKLKSLVSMDPFLGVLNVAVMSIKNGIWDSIYDTIQSFDELGRRSTQSNKHIVYESLDVELGGNDLMNSTDRISDLDPRVTVEDIIMKVTEYFSNESPLSKDEKSPFEAMILLARKLLQCEVWINEKFSVKDFDSLGFGGYLTFIERNISLLPKELHGNISTLTHDQFSFEVSLPKEQLIILLSQASDSLWEDGVVTKNRVTNLLSRQFPMITFDVVENGYLDNSLDTIKEHKNSITSNCILFSATLMGTSSSHGFVDDAGNHSLDCDILGAKEGIKGDNAGSYATKDALEVLLKAPMLVDLNSCLHWDTVYAPSLGPLVRWLLNEVKAKDLLCLLTRDGKIVRIDSLASADSFFKALLTGSSFQVAVELLSLFALYGGRRHLPLSLLKCHARQAFEVLLTNPIEGRQGHDWSSFTNDKSSSSTPGINIGMKNGDGNTLTSHVSRLVLDCLGYLPSEFRCLAADILIFGMQSAVKCAPSVLLQCNTNEQRLMLHEVGFALGIAEWIDDHQKVCPMSADQFSMPILGLPSSSFGSSATVFGNQQQLLANIPHELPSVTHDQQHEGKANVNSLDVRYDIQDEAQVGEVKDGALLIESIRSEEFGLGSDVKSSMLTKQHDRLGRALRCLSQELYSQDSHFLLELIQNADDNAYLGEVEPTLMFILQKTGIIVLNNEKGFTAQNIKALCDVGNSTKKGSSSGYIGQKGIGFKSVFRVTDAPEIHSNGFHIKFDITEGLIGFVLPTVVPPCNVELIGQIASLYPDIDINGWNTCMVLPFKSKLSQGLEMGKIVSMFSDIHPSLLLFLHRLQCIRVINMLDNSVFSMRKEIIGNGLMKVSYGENKITWLIASKKLSDEKKMRPSVQQTEISIAFTLKESENCIYEPHLEQQPVFAFLPLRTYGLKFILQGDFVLPSSREEVDGDSSWNQWLLSEFPDLFVSAEKSFCSLPCFREHPGKAVAAYMHFVPLSGEVQGFFYGLPRMIFRRLMQTDCLLQEGCEKLWIPPCKALRSWNEQARVLLPDILLNEHLGLGFLDKDIILPDSLARALGIQEYGPKILVDFMSSICCAGNGLKSMGLRWLSLCLHEIHVMLHSSKKSTEIASFEVELITSLSKVPFLPLSDGTYGSISEGKIWLNIDSIKTSADNDTDSKAFPKLYSSLRTVNPSLFSAVGDNFVNNIVSILHKIGVQNLTAHEIIKAHILPIISDDKIANEDRSLFLECNAFVMLHLQSSCTDCSVESENIIAELQSKAFLLTNHGFKRLRDVAIHFGKEFGNSVDVSRFTQGLGYTWHEVDVLYLKHPLAGSLACGLKKWREFFQSLGITDFVKVTQIERNISDASSNFFQLVKLDRDLIFSGMLVRDWESQELKYILSSFARNGNHASSKYLLEVLDTLWDAYFCDRTACYLSSQSGENNTSIRSSLMNNIYDTRWVTSSMDEELHYPRDLFYDCDAVRSTLGNFAPYAVPMIKNNKFLADIGLKTAVTIDDILASLQKWRLLQPFKASISQMSRFYTFIARELATSKKKVMDALSSGPFIFVPCASGVSHEEDVVGLLLSPEEVYWHDRSGALDAMKKLSFTTPVVPVGNILCDIYPSLRDFFVDVCGVNETPSFRYYLQILKQISMRTLPLEAANAVFRIFLRWSEGMRSDAMVDDDVFYLRDHLRMLEFSVLPALQDKWVSLHPSFGLVCWVDDDSLKKQFKHSDNIEFLNFGELTSEEKEMLNINMSILMRKLGIPSLKEVVTREAIYYGPTDSNFKASLVAWSLPFAQRYIYIKHSEIYAQLKLSGFEKVQGLKIVVVEKLYYRNVIKKCGATSKKRFECSCLLQDMVLYATQDSDTENLFTELSHLFFDGVPELELDLAKFLQILTAMVESGFTEQNMEFFILNSQKMAKIPDDEPIWSLSSLQSAKEHDQANLMNFNTTETNELKSSLKPKNKGSACWPPVGWKTAPGFDYGILSKGSSVTDQGWYEAATSDSVHEVTEPTADMLPTEIIEDYIIEDLLPEMSRASQNQLHSAPDRFQARDKSIAVPTSVVIESYCPEGFSSKPNDIAMTPEAQEAAFIGRLGEEVAFRHLKVKHGSIVKWMNEEKESGLPFDIVIGEKGGYREYMEVKTSRYASKNWVKISTREWQFAVEKGDRFSIFHIVMSNKESAKITIFKNPVKLCQLGKLDLAVMMPRQQQPGPSAVPQ